MRTPDRTPHRNDSEYKMRANGCRSSAFYKNFYGNHPFKVITDHWTVQLLWTTKSQRDISQFSIGRFIHINNHIHCYHQRFCPNATYDNIFRSFAGMETNFVPSCLDAYRVRDIEWKRQIKRCQEHFVQCYCCDNLSALTILHLSRTNNSGRKLNATSIKIACQWYWIEVFGATIFQTTDITTA